MRLINVLDIIFAKKIKQDMTKGLFPRGFELLQGILIHSTLSSIKNGSKQQ